jgi:hypothetical protein
MGALIMTKGTKRLAAHYNDEFDTWLTFYKTNIGYFARTGDIDIWNDIVQRITDSRVGIGHTERTDKLTLLPKDHLAHPNLHLRWKKFLQNVLSQANRNKLCDAIHTALGTNAAYILFDVVHGASQDVLLDSSQSDDGSPIALITIVVKGHMPAFATDGDDLPPLDGPWPPDPYGEAR